MRLLIVAAAGIAAVIATATELAGTNTVHDPAATMQIALAREAMAIEPAQTCSDGSISTSGCAAPAIRMARGNECPASSGSYCSDEFPYCCGTPGNYYCAKDVNSC